MKSPGLLEYERKLEEDRVRLAVLFPNSRAWDRELRNRLRRAYSTTESYEDIFDKFYRECLTGKWKPLNDLKPNTLTNTNVPIEIL